MSNYPSRWTARSRLMRSAVFALGLAASAAIAHAQPAKTPAQSEKVGPPAPLERPAPSDNPEPVEGVTVTPGRVPDTGAAIPSDKRAQFDAEAARQAAFKEYRESRPPLTADEKGVGDPNDDSKDFPGLQSYLPQ